MKSTTLVRGQESLNFNLMRMTFNNPKDQYYRPLTVLSREELVAQKHHTLPLTSNGNRGYCTSSTEHLSLPGLHLTKKMQLKLKELERQLSKMAQIISAKYYFYGNQDFQESLKCGFLYVFIL